MVCGRSITCTVRQWEVAVWRLCFYTPHTTTTRFISLRAAAAAKVSQIHHDWLNMFTSHRWNTLFLQVWHFASWRAFNFFFFSPFTFLKSSWTNPLSDLICEKVRKKREREIERQKKKWCWSQSGLDRIDIKHPEATFSGEPGFWFCLFNKADGEGEASQNKLSCILFVPKSLKPHTTLCFARLYKCLYSRDWQPTEAQKQPCGPHVTAAYEPLLASKQAT